jgi:hypothetical protein
MLVDTPLICWSLTSLVACNKCNEDENYGRYLSITMVGRINKRKQVYMTIDLTRHLQIVYELGCHVF